MLSSLDHSKRLEGCLLGIAIADALGLPYEGLPPSRAIKLLGRAAQSFSATWALRNGFG